MADDSEFIKELFDYHPCDTPRGMLYYKLEELTDEQRNKLNAHKVKIIRNNQIYLRDHPEVKIITSTLLKGVMRARPKYHIHKFLVKHLMDSWADIKKEIEVKTAERERKLAIQRQRMATIAYLRNMYQQEGFEEADEFDEQDFKRLLAQKKRDQTKKICKSVLNDIIIHMEVKEKHRVQIQVLDDSSESNEEKAEEGDDQEEPNSPDLEIDQNESTDTDTNT